MIQQGYLRATEDIDLLLEESRDNIDRVRNALEFLPDKAIREMSAQNLENFTVVRVADSIIVDLMLRTCGISYEQAKDEVEWAGGQASLGKRESPDYLSCVFCL